MCWATSGSDPSNKSVSISNATTAASGNDVLVRGADGTTRRQGDTLAKTGQFALVDLPRIGGLKGGEMPTTGLRLPKASTPMQYQQWVQKNPFLGMRIGG